MARYKRRPSNIDMFPGLFDQQDSASDSTPKTEQKTEPKHITATPNRLERTISDDGAPDAPPRIIEDETHKTISSDSGETVSIEPLPVGPPISRLKFISFGSGSSGNCAYLGTGDSGILIDAGIDPTKVTAALLRAGIDMSSVGGILLTHDHGDHIRYAYTFMRRNRHLRLYCTPKTLNGLLRRHNVSRRIKDYHQPIFKEFPFHLGKFVITPFEVSHDGSDNVGFFIQAGQHRFVVATDMGVISPRADYYMRLAHHLMIEANYDLNMLINGTYPEYLQARILSDTGHMDNKATAAYLADIVTPKLQNIFLCHLSHDNNTPEVALSTITDALKAKGKTIGDFSGNIDIRLADLQVMTLPRFDTTPTLRLRLRENL